MSTYTLLAQALGTTAIAGILILLLVVIVVLWFFSYYNRIIRLENRIDNSWAQIDVQLRRRGELIPNLLETVKGYAKHERETLENVTKARSALLAAKTPQDAMQADNFLTSTLRTLFAVSEAYPDLKANTNFLQLQDELSKTENLVAFSRQHYNDSVLTYNNTIETYPGVIFARRMGKTEKQMLQTPTEIREVPKVKF